MLKLDFSKEWDGKNCLVIGIINCFSYFTKEQYGDGYFCMRQLEGKPEYSNQPTESEARSWCEEQATARLEAVLEFIDERRVK